MIFTVAINQKHHAQNTKENGRPPARALIRRIVGKEFSFQFFQSFNEDHRDKDMCKAGIFGLRVLTRDLNNRPNPARRNVLIGRRNASVCGCHELASSA